MAHIGRCVVTIEEVRVLTVRCDHCRTMLHTDDYAVYFADEAEVDEVLEDQEWSGDRGSHLCPTCKCAQSGHELETYPQGYRSCNCGARYERAVVVRDRLERV